MEKQSDNPNPLCACGCGEHVLKPDSRWLKGHAIAHANMLRKAEAYMRQQETPQVLLKPVEVAAEVKNVWRGVVEMEFAFSYNERYLKVVPGELIVDTPLYQHMVANGLPVLWEQ